MQTIINLPLNFIQESWQIWSISINTLVFIIALVIGLILIWKIKFFQKGYKLLFIFYTCFWIPLMLLRAYTGSMEKSLGDTIYLWLPLAAYGFIGIFARLFGDWYSYLFKSRKAFIYLALVCQIVTYIPIIIYPCLTTNIIQSIGVGIGASCIGAFQLLFNEQYGKSKQFLTVSILSIPPLLADFISSPIQNLVVSFSPTIEVDGAMAYDPNIMKYLWVIGLIFVIISCILGYFVKASKSNFGADVKYKQPIKNKNEWVYFVILAIMGSMIAFVKFANSGGVSTLYIQKLSGGTSQAYEGYNSLIFSMCQLSGGLLTGLLLIKYLGKWQTFTLGAVIWIAYHIGIIFVDDPVAYMGMLSLNGFAYGILYNLVLGFILQRTFKKRVLTPMGVYQSVLSAGIMASTWFTSWLTGPLLKGKDLSEFLKMTGLINLILVGVIVVIWLLYMYSYFLEKNDYRQPWNKKPVREDNHQATGINN